MATLLTTEQMAKAMVFRARLKCPRRQRGPLSWLLDSPCYVRAWLRACRSAS